MNTSGIKPINCNVLVLPDPVEEKKGGVFLPDSVRQRDEHAQTSGTLAACCDDAFEGMNDRPEPGARVCFAKYAGAEVTGDDGQTYRLMKDVDITGVKE